MTHKPLKNIAYIIIIQLLFCVVSGKLYAEDVDNCLLCHKYPGLGIVDEAGNKELYYVNEQLYNNSVHSTIYCSECHPDITKFPHPDAKKVDCATVCHIEDPSTGELFSHAHMIDDFNRSVHGTEGKEHPEDFPTCTYCHENRMFHPVGNLSGTEEGIAREVMGHCYGCHGNKDWAAHFYKHFTHRMHQRRTSERMVALCSSCHEDQTKMERHGLQSVSTFRDTFHWQAIKFQDPDAPNCITCHAPVGYSSHQIMPQNEKGSAIYKDNLVQTCSNQFGLQQCHPGSTPSFAQGKVHPVQFKAGFYETDADASGEASDGLTTFTKLFGKGIDEEGNRWSYIQKLILICIKYFYILLITGLISFMIVHQILDYFATRREMHDGRTHHGPR